MPTKVKAIEHIIIKYFNFKSVWYTCIVYYLSYQLSVTLYIKLADINLKPKMTSTISDIDIKRKASDVDLAEVSESPPKKYQSPADVNCRQGLNNSNEDDSNYFSSYARLSIHRDMIGDYERTNCYRQAILSNYKLFYKKIVADVGAGTVYAIEGSCVTAVAREVIKVNGLEEKIVVVWGKVEEVSLPEKVDIIVSEWMGYMLLYETMLPSVLYARDNWLKQGGYVFPEKASLYLAPLSDHEEYEESVEFWHKVEKTYKVDMSVVAKTAVQERTDRVYVKSVSPEMVVAHPWQVIELDINTVSIEELQQVKGDFECKCFGYNCIHGFVVWFTVQFPGGLVLSTSPYQNETHWGQSILCIPQTDVKQDTILKGSLIIHPNQQFHRFLDIKLNYQKDESIAHSLIFKMDDLP
ncbi:protein arginine N-methyltransferase 6-like isoform X3 [Tachypleus tridentatus]|uniref:protein arginine N-methyltransferase 6-like isoform X3 n=1 Tax=Tachypleus tridentatus TaxID=6853 RepID=UPI003FD656AD